MSAQHQRDWVYASGNSNLRRLSIFETELLSDGVEIRLFSYVLEAADDELNVLLRVGGHRGLWAADC